MEITSFNFSSRLATWKEVLLGGEQTHDGLDDCRDLRDIVAKLAEAEHALMPRVIDTSEDEKCINIHIHKNAFSRSGKKTGHLHKCVFRDKLAYYVI